MAEHPSEVSGNNNFRDDIEENLSEAQNSTQVNNFLTGGSSLQSGNEVIIVAEETNQSSDNIINESIAKTINTQENIRPRSECDGGTRQLKLKNVTKGRATNEELKGRAMARIYRKIGEEKAGEVMARWQEVKDSKHRSKKQIQAECDGIIKTLLSLGFSKAEVMAFLKVGGPRVNRIMESIKNPGKVPNKFKPAHAASEDDIKRVLDFITSLDLEPGYPCAHKKIPLYVVGDHQGSTWRVLHCEYEKRCIKSGSRVLSYNRFREYVQHYLPSIKLGKTQTDLCNECYAINLKLRDPEISVEEKKEIKLKLAMHLDEANIQRRSMNAYIEAVKIKFAPMDPPLRFEPCYIPPVEDEVLDEALNLFKESSNPVLLDIEREDNYDGTDDESDEEVVVDEANSSSLVVLSIWEEEGAPSSPHKIPEESLADESRSPMDKENSSRMEHDADVAGNDQEKDSSPIKKLTQNAKNALIKNIMNRTASKRGEYAETIDKTVVTKMDLEIEDYGQEKLLPSFKLRRPGADYFNSSLNIRNMNFINPTPLGQSSIYLYDERTGGKGGNEVCSIRFHNLMNVVKSRIVNKIPHPIFHVSVLDNCTGQNKSNSAFKFEALQTMLGIFQAKTKLFLKPGHSHNQSDVVTGESNKYLAKKDVFTVDQIATEMNKCEKVNVSVLQQDSFFIWEEFLDKHFRDLPVGFTKFYCFEFTEGTVAMKRLCTEVTDDQMIVKELARDPANARKTILRELFDLPTSASLEDIVNATLLLPKMPSRELKQRKLESLAKKFSCIPSEFLSFYPGGEAFLDKSKEPIPDVEVEEAVTDKLVSKKPKPKMGRPKVPEKTPSNSQSILRFLCAPKIPVMKAGDMMSKLNQVTAFGSKTLGSLDPLNNNYLSGGNSLLLSKKVSICGSEEQEMVDITEEPSMDGSKSAGQNQGRGKTRLGQRGRTYYKIIQ